METKTPYGKNLFVFVVVAFSLSTATAMGFDQTLTTKVAEIVADGLITLAMFVTISFLASYSVDYSGVLTKVGGRVGALVTPPASHYTTVEPPVEEAKG